MRENRGSIIQSSRLTQLKTQQINIQFIQIYAIVQKNIHSFQTQQQCYQYRSAVTRQRNTSTKTRNVHSNATKDVSRLHSAVNRRMTSSPTLHQTYDVADRRPKRRTNEGIHDERPKHTFHRQMFVSETNIRTSQRQMYIPKTNGRSKDKWTSQRQMDVPKTNVRPKDMYVPKTKWTSQRQMYVPKTNVHPKDKWTCQRQMYVPKTNGRSKDKCTSQRQMYIRKTPSCYTNNPLI